MIVTIQHTLPEQRKLASWWKDHLEVVCSGNDYEHEVTGKRKSIITYTEREDVGFDREDQKRGEIDGNIIWLSLEVADQLDECGCGVFDSPER